MTIVSQENIEQYTALADQKDFDFDFRIFSETQDEDIIVYLSAPTQTWNEPAARLLPSEYTISISTTGEGGTVSLVTGAIAGYILTIVRNLPATRTSDFGEGGTFTGQAVDVQLDKLTIIISQLKSLLEERGLLYPLPEVIGVGQTNIPKLSPNELWKADGSGNIVAAECAEEAGCSTLRSELLSQSETAPGTDNVGIYDPDEKVGKTLTEYVEHLRPQFDDIAVVKNKTDATKKVLIDASNVGTGQERKIIMPDTDVDLSTISVKSLPRGHIDGYKLERKGDTGDDAKILVVGAPDINGNSGGEALSRTLDLDLKISTAMTGKVDLSWASGSGDAIGKLAGGLTFTAEGYYHVGLLGKVGSGTIDYGLDNNITFANLLSDANVISAGYNKVRYIGTIQASSVPDIFPFWQDGDLFMWIGRYDPAQPEYKQTGHNLNQNYPVVLRTPPGVIVIAKFGFRGQTLIGAFSSYFLSNLNLASDNFGLGAWDEIISPESLDVPTNFFPIDFPTDDNSSIFYKANRTDATSEVEIWTRGYVNTRGKQ